MVRYRPRLPDCTADSRNCHPRTPAGFLWSWSVHTLQRRNHTVYPALSVLRWFHGRVSWLLREPVQVNTACGYYYKEQNSHLQHKSNEDSCFRSVISFRRTPGISSIPHVLGNTADFLPDHTPVLPLFEKTSLHQRFALPAAGSGWPKSKYN